MKLVIRLALLAGLVALGYWLWTVCFPSPEKVIESNLQKLAKLASFSGNEGNIARIASVERIGSYFAGELEVVVEVPGMEAHTFTRREELTQAAMQARSVAGSLHITLPDVVVHVAPDRKSAVADITMVVKAGGQNDPLVEEFQITLNKPGGDWLITRVEPVKALQH